MNDSPFALCDSCLLRVELSWKMSLLFSIRKIVFHFSIAGQLPRSFVGLVGQAMALVRLQNIVKVAWPSGARSMYWRPTSKSFPSHTMRMVN